MSFVIFKMPTLQVLSTASNVICHGHKFQNANIISAQYSKQCHLLFSKCQHCKCSVQQAMSFVMVINFKMPTLQVLVQQAMSFVMVINFKMPTLQVLSTAGNVICHGHKFQNSNLTSAQYSRQCHLSWS